MYIWQISSLRLMQIKWSKHNKYGTKYAYMYTFSFICYIETVIVLSCNSNTQEAQMIIIVL